MSRYEESIKLTHLTRLVSPGGAQTASKRPERFVEGAFPAYLVGGDGANVWDVDGNMYVDWICGLGAVPLGYGHPAVLGALYDQLEKGLISSSLPTPLEEEVAAKLVQVVPCGKDGGQVRFVKTGSEACSAAIRVARRYTGRDLVIMVGYHGWHDWAQSTSAPHPGVPLDPYVARVPYNDVAQIESIMRLRRVAAVILEPTLLEAPHESYLSDVCTLCTLHGAVSIFDEMVMGFRWARGGGQEFFGVVPDLSVFGKGLANGLPLACVVGPERMMRLADVISGTFGGECLSLAGASATLDVYAQQMEPDVPNSHQESVPIYYQWQHGQWFLNQCAILGIPATGYPVHPKVTYEGEEMALFLQETARRGLLLHPAGFNVSAALTTEDLKMTQRALKGAKEVIDSGEGILEGALPSTPMFVRNT